LTRRAKLRLGAEILATYGRVRWTMRQPDLAVVVGRLRAVAIDSPPPSRSGRLRLARAVARVLSLLPADSRCLVRSLVLLRVLARRGVASTLVIGVRPGSEFAAHAWVECAGDSLIPDGAGEFSRLAEI
jgi:hypothetical protein